MPRTSYLHKLAEAACDGDGQVYTFPGGADIDFQPTAQVYAVLRATDASSVNIAGVETVVELTQDLAADVATIRSYLPQEVQ